MPWIDTWWDSNQCLSHIRKPESGWRSDKANANTSLQEALHTKQCKKDIKRVFMLQTSPFRYADYIPNTSVPMATDNLTWNGLIILLSNKIHNLRQMTLPQARVTTLRTKSADTKHQTPTEYAYWNIEPKRKDERRKQALVEIRNCVKPTGDGSSALGLALQLYNCLFAYRIYRSNYGSISPKRCLSNGFANGNKNGQGKKTPAARAVYWRQKTF